MVFYFIKLKLIKTKKPLFPLAQEERFSVTKNNCFLITQLSSVSPSRDEVFYNPVYQSSP